MKAVNDVQSDLASTIKAIQEEQALYNELYQRRKSQEKIIELEKLKALGNLSSYQTRELNKLKKLEKANSKALEEDKLRVAKLEKKLLEKNVEYEELANRTIAENKLAADIRIADLRLSSLKMQQKTETILNKSIEEKEAERILRIDTIRNQVAQKNAETETILNKSVEEKEAESALRIGTIRNQVAQKNAETEAILNKSAEEKQAEAAYRIADLKKNLAQAQANAEIEQNRSIEELKLQAQIDATKTITDIRKAGNDKLYKDQLEKEESIALAQEKSRLAKERADAKGDKEKLKKIYAQEKAIAKKEKENKSKKAKEKKQRIEDLQTSIFGKSDENNPITFRDRINNFKDIAKDPETGEFSMAAAINNSAAMLSNLAAKLESTMDTIANVGGAVNTRLQGSRQEGSLLGQYWNAINNDFTKYAGVSPFFKREDLTSNLKTMVEKGISYHVAQRAFLMTMKDKIATTFDATNGTLLRLVRIQQHDSTAARLGMESSLTAFLNNMYETSEYMSSLASSVKGSLEEAMSLIDAKHAVSLEHTVQKWMGSMYSVGMSDSAVNSISKAFGDIAAGKIDSLNGDGAGNLVVMAANQAGISIADILQEGMTNDTANDLLAAAVEYLAGLYNENKGSKVVQQQIAKVFGVAASDLKAAANLAEDNGKVLDVIYKVRTEYSTNIDRLYEMANTMVLRSNIGEMMNNMWANAQYSMAAGVANNPILYGIYKVGKLMGDLGADIDIPFLNVYGFGVDLNASLSELMRGGAMAAGILSSLGQMVVGGGGGLLPGLSLASMRASDELRDLITGDFGYTNHAGKAGMLSSLALAGINIDLAATRKKNNVSISGSSLVNAIKMSEGTTVTENSSSGANGMSTSESGSATAGNSSSDDISNTTLSDSKNDANNQMAEAKESEDNAVNIETVNENVVKIYTLLSDVVDGNSSLLVRLSYDSQYMGLN